MTAIRQLHSEASKQDEINHLHKLAETVDHDTYLFSLFSDSFMTWAEEQIKNDFTVNLFEYLQQVRADLSAALNGKARAENEVVVLSIFVNPLQFDRKDDLKDYPAALQIYQEALAREKRPAAQKTLRKFVQDLEAKVKKK